MKNTIKTIAMLMMLISINMVSAQNSTNQSLTRNQNDETAQPADQLFNVNVVHTDGIVHITWNLPICNVEGYYLTERSDNGVDYKPLALKHFINPPATANNIVAMRYSLEDKKPVEGTSYYRFTKSNQQGDILQTSEIPVVAPVTEATAAVSSDESPKP